METSRHLKEFINQDESEALEFKESLQLKDEIGKTISAFSNSKGGNILVGISDKRKIKGVQVGKRTIMELAEYIKRNTDPQIFPEIKIHKLDEKEIIFIITKESREKPVFFKNYVYKRVGNTNQRISSSEIRKLAKEIKEKVYWDEQICEEADLDDIEWNFVKEVFIPLYEKVSEKRIVGKPIDLLKSLNCIIDDKPTNAGILLFGEEPQKFFRSAYVALARYKGKDVDIERLDYKEFTGNLFRQIDQCNAYIIEHIAVMSKLQPGEIRREDIPEYGKFSIRELITNAVCHRNYEDWGSKVIIKMFTDRIEFYNRGGLPEGITPRNIVTEQYSRNPTIARILAKVEYIEELGEGWDKIIKEHKMHSLKPKPPLIKANKFSVLVTIFSTKDKFEEKIFIKLNERQRKALEYVKKEGHITNTDYRKIFPGITDRTILNDLKDLVTKGVLKRIGKTKGAYYMLRIPK